MRRRSCANCTKQGLGGCTKSTKILHSLSAEGHDRAEASKIRLSEEAISLIHEGRAAIEERERQGLPPPELFPHPDDIHIADDLTVTFTGPYTLEQAAETKRKIERRDRLIEQIEASGHLLCSDNEAMSERAAAMLAVIRINNSLPARLRRKWHLSAAAAAHAEEGTAESADTSFFDHGDSAPVETSSIPYRDEEVTAVRDCLIGEIEDAGALEALRPHEKDHVLALMKDVQALNAGLPSERQKGWREPVPLPRELLPLVRERDRLVEEYESLILRPDKSDEQRERMNALSLKLRATNERLPERLRRLCRVSSNLDDT